MPIPLFGELCSLDPVLVSPGAAEEQPEQIGAGLGGSTTLGGGQFCAKPGLVLLPLELREDNPLGLSRRVDGVRNA